MNKIDAEVLSKALEEAHNGIAIISKNGTFKWINSGFADLTGYNVEEIRCQKSTEIFEQLLVEEGEKFFPEKELSSTSDTVSREVYCTRKDGTSFWAKVSFSPIHDEKGDFENYVAVCTEITEIKKARHRLKESEERWQRLVDFNPDTVLVLVDGYIKYINEAGVEMVGASSKEEVIGKHASIFTTKEYQDKLTRRLKMLAENKLTEPTEYSLLTLDGKMKFVKAQSVQIKYQGEDAIQTVLTDITDLKDRERQLKESQHRFSSLFEHNPHPVYYFDLEGNFMGANKKTEEVSAYPEDELLSMNFAPIIAEEDLERTVRHFEKSAGGEAQEYEIKIKTKDGQIKDLRVMNFPIKVSDEIVGVFGIAEDITTRKKAAADLKKSEQKWQHLVEESPQPVQVTIDAEIVFINDAGARLYGSDKPEEVVGRSVFEFSHPDYVKDVEERKARLEKGLKVEQLVEHKIVLMNGETRYVEVNSIPIIYQGEDAIQTVLHDITDRKKKESMIEAALVEKEVLLKEIHHRVKNNMAVISGLLELQSMNTKDPDLQVLLKESQLRIYSMAMIHEKLYQTETFADIEFGEYVKELVETITNTVDVPTKDVTVSFNLKPIRLNINQAIPSALILNEVVVNSFKHAFKGQESGNINISIRQIENNIILKVKDDGCGLPDDFKVEDHQSLGTTLIDTLTKQLRGDLSIAAGPDGKGTLVEVSFSKDS